MRGYGNDSRQTRPFGMPVSGSVSETALISNLPNSVRRTGVPYLELSQKESPRNSCIESTICGDVAHFVANRCHTPTPR
jgi:hypothetical protein